MKTLVRCPDCKTEMQEKKRDLKGTFDFRGLPSGLHKTYYECPKCKELASAQQKGFCWIIANGFWYLYGGNSWEQIAKKQGFIFR
jgi:hypothetical protein